MPDLIYDNGYNRQAREAQKHMSKLNLQLCIRNAKQDLEIADLLDKENLSNYVANKLAGAFGYPETIKSPEGLAEMRVNFEGIKICLAERSDDHDGASHMIDKCEPFVENGEISYYNDCLESSAYDVWKIEL